VRFSMDLNIARHCHHRLMRFNHTALHETSNNTFTAIHRKAQFYLNFLMHRVKKKLPLYSWNSLRSTIISLGITVVRPSYTNSDMRQ